MTRIFLAVLKQVSLVSSKEKRRLLNSENIKYLVTNNYGINPQTCILEFYFLLMAFEYEAAVKLLSMPYANLLRDKLNKSIGKYENNVSIETIKTETNVSRETNKNENIVNRTYAISEKIDRAMKIKSAVEGIKPVDIVRMALDSFIEDKYKEM